MTRRELIDLCLSWPGSYEDYPFDGIPNSGAEGDSWAVIRHRGNKKSFALIFERLPLSVFLAEIAVFVRYVFPSLKKSAEKGHRTPPTMYF